MVCCVAMRIQATLLLLVFPLVGMAKDGDLLTANLGDFRLESGAVIRDCHLGYRTFGTLNDRRSNAILFPTWFTGTSQDLVSYVGPERMADSSRHFVILVDALGNGVSSSPSNSRAQPRLAFPRFTIRDMVHAEYQLVTKVLGISHLRAVMGVSMGGMQTFEWAASYPAFMDRIVPIVGSPQLTSFDIELWEAERAAIEESAAYQHGKYTAQPELPALRLLHDLHLRTPSYRAIHTHRADAAKMLKDVAATRSLDANDYLRQLEAMLAHDAAKPWEGSLPKLAAAIRAKALIIVGNHDMMVNPRPALEVGKMMHAEIIQLENDCGHLAPDCEADRVVTAVRWFLM